MDSHVLQICIDTCFLLMMSFVSPRDFLIPCCFHRLFTFSYPVNACFIALWHQFLISFFRFNLIQTCQVSDCTLSKQESVYSLESICFLFLVGSEICGISGSVGVYCNIAFLEVLQDLFFFFRKRWWGIACDVGFPLNMVMFACMEIVHDFQ